MYELLARLHRYTLFLLHTRRERAGRKARLYKLALALYVCACMGESVAMNAPRWEMHAVLRVSPSCVSCMYTRSHFFASLDPRVCVCVCACVPGKKQRQ